MVHVEADGARERATPGCDVASAPATSVRLKPRRTASRIERSCWRFIAARGRLAPAEGATHGRTLKRRASVLLPRQAVKAPAVDPAALAFVVDLAFEAFEHVVDARIACIEGGVGSSV